MLDNVIFDVQVGALVKPMRGSLVDSEGLRLRMIHLCLVWTDVQSSYVDMTSTVLRAIAFKF